MSNEQGDSHGQNCKCTKCKGKKVVSQRSERRHRAKAHEALEEEIPSFSAFRENRIQEGLSGGTKRSGNILDSKGYGTLKGEKDADYPHKRAHREPDINLPIQKINLPGPSKNTTQGEVSGRDWDIEGNENEETGESLEIHRNEDNAEAAPHESAAEKEELPVQDKEEEDIIEASRQEEVLTQTATLASMNRQAQAAPGDANPHEDEDEEPPEPPSTESLRVTQELVELIKSATLEDCKLDRDTLNRLRNPPIGTGDISDQDIRLSLDLFLATTNASEKTYNDARQAILRRFPSCEILTFHRVKELIAELSGVVSVEDDMCINSCLAYVGPLSDRTHCMICGEARYNETELRLTGKKMPRLRATTFPLGPQLQARRRCPESAHAAQYCAKKFGQILERLDEIAEKLVDEEDFVYDDIMSGNDFIYAAEKIKLTANDTVVLFSIDGAQLYQNKKSDTWIAIWILVDLSPGDRYKKKHILPSTIIPGPNKPKMIDTFLFRAIHHLSALQRCNGGAGIPIWDASMQSIIYSRVLFALGMADTVGLTELDGRVGHHGAHGCRLGCLMKGRHKPGSGHYYAAHLCPNHYTVTTCLHPDVDARALELTTAEEYQADLTALIDTIGTTGYKTKRKDTGISKPSLLSGLHPDQTIPVPRCFSLDLMHLATINIEDLLISLWRGTIKRGASDKEKWPWATLVGDTWKQHGQLVGSATQYFPTSFHRPPRNPAEKINSGYKATEFYLYVFGLCPALLRNILPFEYWQNFCKLVRAIRIIMQRSISFTQVQDAQTYIVQFIEEYEVLYYQRRVDRLHFCRPCIHSLAHIPSEIMRIGPGAYSTQFALERTIGDLGKEIRQPSNPFANLAQRALLRSQTNALRNMYPELDSNDAGSIMQEYALLGPKDKEQQLHILQGCELRAIFGFCQLRQVRRYGRVMLPNGQIARSVYREEKLVRRVPRVARNVKIQPSDSPIPVYAEVLYFFYPLGSAIVASDTPLALTSVYSEPHQQLLSDSFETVYACRHTGILNLRVFPANEITSVISMQPLPPEAITPPAENYWFVVEKSSLESFDGYTDPAEEIWD